MGNSYSRIARPTDREPIKAAGPKYFHGFHQGSPQSETTLSEDLFHSMLTLERRRAERSRKPFVLMLMDAHLENGAAEEILRRAIDIIVKSKRETDLVGWYKQGAILGMIFTEVSLEGELPITEILRAKIETALVKHLGPDRAAKVANSVHLFPESWEKSGPGLEEDSKLYPVLNKKVS